MAAIPAHPAAVPIRTGHSTTRATMDAMDRDLAPSARRMAISRERPMTCCAVSPWMPNQAEREGGGREPREQAHRESLGHDSVFESPVESSGPVGGGSSGATRRITSRIHAVAALGSRART